MEKKQTAVEYLVEQLFKIHNNTTDVKEMNSESIIEKAKQMEKEQMKDAWVNGCDNGYDKACDNITWEEMDSAKDNYYNETYAEDEDAEYLKSIGFE